MDESMESMDLISGAYKRNIKGKNWLIDGGGL